MFLLNWIRKKTLLRKWRKNRKRKKTIRLRISNVMGVLQAMEDAGIHYVVLRWPEEVPLTPQQEETYDKDIDLLTDVNTAHLAGLAEIASRNPGRVACDLYSISGRGGTFYMGMPYYPPALAEEILKSRQRHKNGVYAPEPRMVFLSLAFHLVYHKGLLCGIPTGCELTPEASPKRPYQQHIEMLGRAVGAPIEPPYTLLKLHTYLRQCRWSMPYDLLERWPNKSPWHQYLLQYEIDLLRPWAEKLPGLLVFFIRQAAARPEQVDFILGQLSQKFQILKQEQLDEKQMTRVIHLVRGGNWLQGKQLVLVPPKLAVICYDHNPVPVETADAAKNTMYPLVRNKNVFIKQVIRDMLNHTMPADEEGNGIHGSDNEYEAQHMLRAIYDDRANEMNIYLEGKIKSGKE